MKKISNVLLSISILLITLMLFVVEYNKNNEIYQDTTNTFKTKNSLAIMLDDGNGNYTPSDKNAFPTSGYTFNTELSKCENGGEVTWDEANKKVIVSSNVSDKCYIYFDKIVIKLSDHIKSLYTTQGSNNLYHHDGTILATEANASTGVSIGDIIDANDGSYRYSGSYETTNNWVCFGTDDATKTYAEGWCDDEHLYRIIGVFDSVIIDDAGNATGETEARTKLIKAYEGTEDSLGTAPNSSSNSLKNATYYKGKLDAIPGYYWSGSNQNQSNNWTKSTLNTDVLNGTYLTELDKDGNDWTSNIAITEWKIGGNMYQLIYNRATATAYQNEIVNPSTNIVYNAKIGLMYASDYGYATSQANWSTALGSYNNDTNRYNNWMFIGMDEWTISPNVSQSYNVFVVYDDGNVRDGIVYIYYYGVRPTFYLNSDVMLTGGEGTETNPYRIA